MDIKSVTKPLKNLVKLDKLTFTTLYRAMMHCYIDFYPDFNESVSLLLSGLASDPGSVKWSYGEYFKYFGSIQLS